jgi:hypothetical protein
MIGIRARMQHEAVFNKMFSVFNGFYIPIDIRVNVFVGDSFESMGVPL